LSCCSNYSYSISFIISTSYEYSPQVIEGEVDYQGDKKDNSAFVGSDNVKKVLERYYVNLSGEYARKNTIKQYMKNVKLFLNYVKGDFSEESLDVFGKYVNGNYKQNSRHGIFYSVNRFLKWYGIDYLYKLPGVTEGDTRTLNESQVENLIESSKNDAELHLVICLLFDSILRPDEIINIKISNIQGRELFLKDTKTGNGSVVLSKRVLTAISKYIEIRPESLKEYSDYLLISKNRKWNGKPYTTFLPFRKRLRSLSRNIGITFDVTPYTLRRTSITLRFDKTSRYFAGDPKTVQIMARHKNLVTTLGYDKRDKNDVRKYLESIEDVPREEKDIQVQEKDKLVDEKDIHTLLLSKKEKRLN